MKRNKNLFLTEVFASHRSLIAWLLKVLLKYLIPLYFSSLLWSLWPNPAVRVGSLSNIYWIYFDPCYEANLIDNTIPIIIKLLEILKNSWVSQWLPKILSFTSYPKGSSRIFATWYFFIILLFSCSFAISPNHHDSPSLLSPTSLSLLHLFHLIFHYIIDLNLKHIPIKNLL